MNFQLTRNGSPQHVGLPLSSPYRTDLVGASRAFYFADAISVYNNLPEGKVKPFGNYCLANSQRPCSKVPKLGDSRPSSEAQGNVYSPENGKNPRLDALMTSSMQTTGQTKALEAPKHCQFTSSKPLPTGPGYFFGRQMAPTPGPGLATSHDFCVRGAQVTRRRQQQSPLTRPNTYVSPFSILPEEELEGDRELARAANEEARAQNLIEAIEIKSLAPSMYDIETNSKQN